jgi:hypothetical protein
MDVQIFAKVEPKLREKIDIVKLLELSNSRNGIVCSAPNERMIKVPSVGKIKKSIFGMIS